MALINDRYRDDIRNRPAVVAEFLSYLRRISIYPGQTFDASALADLYDGLVDGGALADLVPALGLPGSADQDDF